ncbi:MAG: glycosyltransferase [Planctomycetes bacterium]|nr:glycosyltransferase [Planctomycetota bacterium]MCB9892530.1 glycosyltransferase [Planctomycetota bacterium]MCB9919984.1 glycosyltransferase [Planctomycetota bacterium]
MPTRQVDVSVVVPTLDEELSLPRLLASLRTQTVLPRELIIVDGGSSDRTCELVRAHAAEHRDYDVRLIEVADSRPGKSRNIGTRAATSDIVACSDAGVILEPSWLEALTRSIRDGTHRVAVGTFVPEGTSLFERLAGLLLIRPPERVKVLYAGGVSIAFEKAALEAVGGYPEDVYPCEDAVFLRDLVSAGIDVGRASDAKSLWRPRPNVTALWRQYRSYAWGDAQIGLGAKRHLLRAGFWLLCLVAIFGVFGTMARIGGSFALAAYLLRPTLTAWSTTRDVRTFLLGPLILATKDVAQMFGYVEGRIHRIRGGARDFTKR